MSETLKIDLFDDYARVDVDDDNITQILAFISMHFISLIQSRKIVHLGFELSNPPAITHILSAIFKWFIHFFSRTHTTYSNMRMTNDEDEEKNK